MTKKTILLLHAGGFTSQMWSDIEPLLDKYECLIPDLPGHGTNRGMPFVSIEQTADFFADRLREHVQEGEKVIVAGLSLGAYVGFALAERHPDLIERAMLCGFQTTGIEQASRLKFLARLLSPLFNIRYFRQKNYQAIGLDASSKLIDWAGAAPSSSGTVVNVLNASVDFARSREELARIQVPMLAIAAQHDQPANVTSLPILDASLPEGAGYIVEAEVHFWPLKRPSLFAEILEQWISESPLTDNLVPVQVDGE